MSDVIKLSSPSTHEFWELPVPFEDEHLLALDKPAGLLTGPDPAQPERPSLLELLHAAIRAGKPWTAQRGWSYLMPAQRLDEGASGLLVLAKSKPALVALLNQFNADPAVREYHALVHGNPPEQAGDIDAKLAPDPARPGITRVDARRGKRSRTHFEVVERFARFTWLHCTALPDRAHQVRVHLRTAGFPVVGDTTYRGHPLLLSRLKPHYELKPGKVENPLIRRPALHASRLAFPHPISGQPLEMVAPLPKDLQVGLKYLRRFGLGPEPPAEPPTQ